MRRKIALITAVTLLIAMSAGACARESEPTTFTGDTSEEPKYQASLNPISPSAYGDVRGLELEPGTYISIIGKTEGTAFWKTVRSGVMQAAEDFNAELGYTGSDKIKVTYNGPAKTEDIDEQVNILDEELSRYPDVIGIASIDEDACTVQFDLATENGIPIIALDSGNQYQGIQCTVKTDSQDAARTGAYKLAGEIDKKGDVLVLAHDSKSETARERVQGFQNEIEENHPGVNVAEVIYCDKLEEIKKQMADEENQNLAEGERAMDAEGFSDADAIQYVLESHPGVKGVFATNDRTTLLGLEAVRQAEQAREEDRTVQEQDRAGDKDQAVQEQDRAGDEDQAVQEQDRAGDEDQAVQEQDGAKEEEPQENDSKGNEEPQESESAGNTEPISDTPIVLMGFDVGKEQLKALEAGEISGLVVQNPFGIGYASVVAAARTVLQAGNEAQVSTGYVWVTKDNMNDASIQKMLYE